MILYLCKRLLMMLPMLLGITLVSFAVIQLAPGSPSDLMVDMNPQVSDLARERLHKFYGLDKPVLEQYWNWLKNLAALDFGQSFAPDGRPVWDKIVERLPITVSINVLSLLLTFLVALPLGVYSAVHRGSWLDKGITIFVFIGFAAPTFWLALLAMMLFGVHLGWLPISGIQAMNHDALSWGGKAADYASHLFLPVLLSSFVSLAGLSRYMRSNMLEVIAQDYITTARAKGLRERAVICRHALRNALMPVITILGLSVPGLIGGSVIFESVFAIPGMGKLFYDGVMARDYPLIMGCLVLGAGLTLLGNLLADIGYALADPRVRREGR
ncbi:MAG: ABC transporter permease [Desulfarculales bacterium]|jgi:peptide/nickel transport system permease protein|nr:ABC transporter permease [Desulfarculales bacterium]